MVKLSDEKLLSLWLDSQERINRYRHLALTTKGQTQRTSYGVYKSACRSYDMFWGEISRRMG